MEVFADGFGYTVSVDSRELQLLESSTLEGEVLLVTDQEPFNVPSGKRLTLRVDSGIEEISVQSSPRNSDWKGLQRIDVTLSSQEYQEICYGRGRVYGFKPRLSTDILVQDMNAA